MTFLELLQAATPLATFIGGYLFHAGHEHREARLRFLILSTLTMEGPLVGLDMVRRGLGKRGVIYVRLGQMEEQGLIESDLEAEPPVPQGLRRRIYGITEVGRAWLKVERARP